MPSAIKVKKMAANTWSSENEAETKKDPVAETDSEKSPTKSKKESVAQASSHDSEIIDAKRKRTVPKEELTAAEWLKENFETAEDGTLKVMKLYGLFTKMCIDTALALPPITVFRRVVTNTLGGSQYQVKDTSVYKGVVHEKKKVQKDPSETKRKVAPTTAIKMKMKEHIIEALKEGGSPKKGLRFSWIKNNLMVKFPRLRLDLDATYLKIALERCVSYGAVQLVRGIGLMGFYRIPGDYPESEDEKPKKKKTKDVANAPEKEAGKEDKDKQENGESKEEGDKKEENGKAEETPSEEKKKVKSKKKKSKSSKARSGSRDKWSGVSRHVQPKTISDVFPMAMTFMTEPKDASANRIKKYIEKYFPETNLYDNFRNTLLKGCEKGLWEQVTGSGVQGSYRLLVQDINPLFCETLEDKICLSILASHEPKQTSIILLKEYLIEYHPNFAVDKRPHYFKMAIKKEEKKGTIIRLAGIGCSGSFQLDKPFTPCPNWLAGEEDDYVEVASGESSAPSPLAQQEYKARPSKRKGRGRTAAALGRQPDFISYSSTSRPTKIKPKKRKVVYTEDSDSDDEVEVAPKKRKTPTKKPSAKRSTSSKRKPVAKKGRRQSRKVVEESEKEGEESETETKESKSPPKPKASPSKKSPAKKSAKKSKSTAKSPASSKKTSARKEAGSDLEEGEFHSPRSKKKINYSEDQHEASEDKQPVKSRQKRSPVKKYTEPETSDEEGEVPVPRKRKAYDDESENEHLDENTPKKSSRFKGRAKYSESEDDESPSKSRSRSTGKGSSKRAAAAYSDSEDDEPQTKSRSRGKSSSKKDTYSESEDDEPPNKSGSRGKSSYKTAAFSDDEDDEPPSKSRSTGQSSSKRAAAQSDSEEETRLSDDTEKRPAKSSKKSAKKSAKKSSKRRR